MRSGVTDQYIYFVAVDATNFTTRETGLSSFTVYRSRNGGAAVAMTTPTINETDASNMPGVYQLLLDEDTTIDAGDDSQEMVFHITHAGMAPVTRTIELYRPKITAGNTLGVESDGDLTKVNTLDGHTAQTGDSFARLGAPAGASVSADIAAIEAQTDDIGAAGAGLTALASASAMATAQADLDTLTGADGATLATSQPNYAPAVAGNQMDLVNAPNATAVTAIQNGLATATKLLAYVQLLARSDAAIETDNATELGEINANEGSGAGDYSAQTDSGEAVRDWIGNGSNLTEAGGTGDQLTAVPWNAAWDAEVQSEAADALNAYDPPTKAELDSGLAALNDPTAAAIADAVWEEAIADHSGTAGSTAEALAGATAPSAADVADAVWEEAIADHSGTAGSTAEALAGATAPSAADVADAVWDEAIAGHLGAGSTGEALNAAGGSGDPWVTTLPGSYTGSQAGKILADVLVDTNELQTDDVPGLIAALNDLDAAGVRTAVGLASANLDTQLGDLPTAAENADAVWDEAVAGHVAAGSFGEEVQAHALSSEVGALNDLSAAEVNAEVDTALSDYDGPTKAELDSGLAALNDPTAAAIADAVWEEAIADHSGTAGSTAEALAGATAPSAATVADAVWDEAKAGHVGAGSFGEEVQAHALSSEVSALNDLSSADVTAAVPTAAQNADAVWDEAKAGHVGAGSFGEEVQAHALSSEVGALNDLSAAEVNAEVVDVVRTDVIPDSVPADGSRPTVAQALLMINRFLMEKGVSGTTVTVNKEDGVTSSMTFTLDDATNPTSITRSA